MVTMQNSDVKGLADIVGPYAPAPLPSAAPIWWLLAVGLFLLLAIAAIVLWRRRSAPQRRSLKCLQHLRQRVATGQLPAQASTYLLAAEMCRRFNLQRLSENSMPSGFASAEQVSWQYFVAALDRLRYQAGDPEKNLQVAQQLLEQATHWLERKTPC